MLAESVSSDESETSQSTCSSMSTDQTLLDLSSNVSNLDENSSLSTEISDCAMGTEVKSPESIEPQHFHVTTLQPSVFRRVSYHNYVVQSLKKKHKSVKKIAKILSRTKCRLSNVICLRNVELTRAFMKEKDSMSDDNFDCDFVPQNMRLKKAFGKVNDLAVDDDSQASIGQVMTKLDVQNAEVILKYGADKDSRIKHFFRNLVLMSTKRRNWKVLNVFVKKSIEWNILNDEASKLIEQEVFQKATKEIIEIYMECEIGAYIEKNFKRNALTALFGNINLNIRFLKKLRFDTNARGTNGFTALHYAVQNSLINNVKFLLDYGAEPNSINSRNETPLILTLYEPQVNSIHNKKCAELLLQHGADPFLLFREGQSFDSCIHSNHTSSQYLMELALAYVCIYEVVGAANLSDDNAKALNGINTLIKQNDNLFNLYMKCKQQLKLLKKEEIRKNLTMFMIISTTGDKFFRLIDEKDRRKITSFIDKYCQDTLHPYYINALNEHMRQYRKLLFCHHKAALIISEYTRKPVTYHKILDKVLSYFTIKELLEIQKVDISTNLPEND